jgi:hypothetical protein
MPISFGKFKAADMITEKKKQDIEGHLSVVGKWQGACLRKGNAWSLKST